jgi:hypothetical protein
MRPKTPSKQHSGAEKASKTGGFTGLFHSLAENENLHKESMRGKHS